MQYGGRELGSDSIDTKALSIGSNALFHANQLPLWLKFWV
jgi:hypothetical protein